MFDQQLAQLSPQPPRSLDSLPGLRFWRIVPRFAVLFPVIFVAIFLLVPLSILSTDPMARLDFGPTKAAEGRVVSAADVQGCGGPARRIVYEFEAEAGHHYRGASTQCSNFAFYGAKQGEAVDVEFLASNPSIHRLRDGSRSNAPPLALFLVMPLFFLAIFSPMYAPQLREALRARKCFKKGRIAQGNVVYVKRRLSSSWPGWPGNLAADVYIEFQRADGTKTEASAWCSNDWLLHQLAPGTPVRIAYLDDGRKGAVLLENYVR